MKEKMPLMSYVFMSRIALVHEPIINFQVEILFFVKPKVDLFKKLDMIPYLTPKKKQSCLLCYVGQHLVTLGRQTPNTSWQQRKGPNLREKATGKEIEGAVVITSEQLLDSYSLTGWLIKNLVFGVAGNIGERFYLSVSVCEEGTHVQEMKNKKKNNNRKLRATIEVRMNMHWVKHIYRSNKSFVKV